MTVTIEAARASLVARELAEQALGHARAERILGHAPEIVALLRSAGARRIVLFGSLATGSAHSNSDLDLAVDGLPGARYFEVLAELMRVSGCAVDLVRLEEAGESLLARIAAEGRTL
jgi:uncharacterized protein